MSWPGLPTVMSGPAGVCRHSPPTEPGTFAAGVADSGLPPAVTGPFEEVPGVVRAAGPGGILLDPAPAPASASETSAPAAPGRSPASEPFDTPVTDRVPAPGPPGVFVAEPSPGWDTPFVAAALPTVFAGALVRGGFVAGGTNDSVLADGTGPTRLRDPPTGSPEPRAAPIAGLSDGIVRAGVPGEVRSEPPAGTRPSGDVRTGPFAGSPAPVPSVGLPPAVVTG
jgi:hypothetical protein